MELHLLAWSLLIYLLPSPRGVFSNVNLEQIDDEDICIACESTFEFLEKAVIKLQPLITLAFEATCPIQDDPKTCWKSSIVSPQEKIKVNLSQKCLQMEVCSDNILTKHKYQLEKDTQPNINNSIESDIVKLLKLNPRCVYCGYFLNQVNTVRKRHGGLVNRSLKLSCQVLPFNKTGCEYFMEAFYPMFSAYLDQVISPEYVCSQSSVCKNAPMAHEMMLISSSPKACNLCIALLTRINGFFEDPGEKQLISLDVCKALLPGVESTMMRFFFCESVVGGLLDGWKVPRDFCIGMKACPNEVFDN